METALPRAFAWSAPVREKIDARALAIWALAGGLVLYLAVDGGGYGVVVHSQVGIVVWWIVLVGAAWGLLPATWPGRGAWAALALFSCFVGWTAIATTWSLSTERSLSDLSLVGAYLGVLVLGVFVYGDRERALRHALGAMAVAIVIVAGLALASRLRPGLFPSATQTASFLPGTQRRLSWPLNYWNALAALLAFGVPLLLALATSARRLLVQAVSAASLPALVLCGYLTFSRGGALAAAVAVATFIALAPNRIPKLATVLAVTGGGAILIAAASNRSALERGLVDVAARHQGEALVLPILLVCAGVALVQVGIGLADRHGTLPRPLTVSPSRARLILAGAVVVAVVAALLAGAPTKLSHAWNDFKHASAPQLNQASLSRFGSLSGNQRYDYWRVAVHASAGHVLTGSGPGTFQLLWLPRAPYFSYVQNAHSLYIETYAELGAVGLALLVGFLALILISAVRLVVRSRYESRIRAAGAAAALLAFLVSAAFDWIWQVPALPVAFLLLGAAVLAPRRRAEGAQPRRLVAGVLRGATAVIAVACLVAIGLPLATSNALDASQAAASAGNPTLALLDAQEAARLEPGTASPQLQLALVQELQGNLRPALLSAQRAVRDEPADWTNWLILARLQAENGDARASLAAFRQARALNPRSPVFRNGSRTSTHR
jgi:hypothetical protein